MSLTIDAGLQRAVYELIEQQLAGILYSKIEDRLMDEEGVQGSDLTIPVGDVYIALIENGVLDRDRFSDAAEGEAQYEIGRSHAGEVERVAAELSEKLSDGYSVPLNQESEEWQEYLREAVRLLEREQILDAERIDSRDEIRIQWQNGEISAAQYIRYGISSGWISGWNEGDSAESYQYLEEACRALRDSLVRLAAEDESFGELVFEQMIRAGEITGRQMCMALLEQGALIWDEEEYRALEEGATSAFSYIREKIRTMEISPAQLALDPCTGSCVVLDADTGEVLACVTYPGYDNNRLANGVDGEYYASLLDDASLPLYNNATQQLTAPGSAFKPVVAAAALTEGIITPQTRIEDEGVFTEVTPSPSCWIYPGGTHGNVNVSEAIRDSCNYFFYEMGYRLSLENGVYQEEKGIAALEEYARLFGLGEGTGIEIGESQSRISTEYPVTSAIGQGNNNFSTVELARYALALATRGEVYRLSLQKDSSDRLIRRIESIQPASWEAIRSGMRMAVQGYESFEDFPIEAAGKTGTAQQMLSRPNHAVFIGFAPYEEPEIALAVRIAYGYTSANAAEVGANVIRYYFELSEEEELLDDQAQGVENVGNIFAD